MVKTGVLAVVTAGAGEAAGAAVKTKVVAESVKIIDTNLKALSTEATTAVKGGFDYVPSPKHSKGGHGTFMDLDNITAQQTLENSVGGGKQRYGVHEGKLYEFQPDNAGGFHGYPIPGNQAPTAALKQLLRRGDINNVQYKKMIKGKQ